MLRLESEERLTSSAVLEHTYFTCDAFNVQAIKEADRRARGVRPF
jgi:hypothetical protein